jgi:hypothetical protein
MNDEDGTLRRLTMRLSRRSAHGQVAAKAVIAVGSNRLLALIRK